MSELGDLIVKLQREGVDVTFSPPKEPKERGMFWLYLHCPRRRTHSKTQHTCSSEEELVEALQLSMAELDEDQVQ